MIDLLCPYCKKGDSRVIDSRSADENTSIRRRRACNLCGRRFTTYETVESVPLMVKKNDGCREMFDREKLLKGLIRSCNKRNIPTEKIVNLANDIEQELRNRMEQEISSREIGELVMEKLKDFDDIAYIRFASVYRKFTDITSFRDELEDLMSKKK